MCFKYKVLKKLDRLLEIVNRIDQKESTEMAQLDDLAAAVQSVKDAATTEAGRVEDIINTLRAQAANNPVVAQAITDLSSVAANLNAVEQTPTPTP